MTPAKAQAKNDRSVVFIPLDQLTISPEEIRKTIDQARLQELAASIARTGVIETLLVRTVPPPAGWPESHWLYEIVSGQRRWLASKLAGESMCPCIVRSMTDDEARELRIISNLQRDDLPPMDEAEAYGQLLAGPGATIETVAAALAKSPSYVGRRLQLLGSIEPVRLALKAGAIEVGHALELARLDEAGQRRMLTRMECGVSLLDPEDEEDDGDAEGCCCICGCTEDDPCEGGCGWADKKATVCDNPDCLEQFRDETGQENGEWKKTLWSVAGLRKEIAGNSHRDLKDAPFPLIADLAPMPCTDCPKRAGNAQLLFDDCAQDTCLDRPCFNRKVNAWIQAELDLAKSEKRKLLKLTDRWANDKDKVYCCDYSGAQVLKTPSECPNGEEGIWIDGATAGRRAMVCRKADCETHCGGGSSSGSSGRAKASPKEQADRKALLAKLNAEKKYRAALFTAIGKVPAEKIVSSRGTQLLTRIAMFAIDKSDSTKYAALAEAMGLSKDDFGWRGSAKLAKHVAGLDDPLKALFAYMAIEDGELTVHEHDVQALGKKPLDLEELAQIVGVDWKALREQYQPQAKPTKQAKPAPKAKAKPEKKAKPQKKSAPAKPAKKAAPKKAKAKKRVASAKKAGRK